MLELGVDELTLVLQIAPTLKVPNTSGIFDWETVAEDVITRFETKADLINVFGYKLTEKRAPNGYQTAYTYGEHIFYFAIGYHPLHMNMGIVVKFSAQALSYFCEKTNLQVYEFLQKVADTDYSIRLSRIDLTCDFIDEDIDTTKIYQDLIDSKVGIFREIEGKDIDNPIYKRVFLEYKGFANKDEIPSIYIGSPQSNSQMRIYDKKREQIERKGTKYQKALNCNNWVRFEAVFKHEYAHQITKQLLTTRNNIEFANLIACIMVQKYRFMTIGNGIADCETNYTQMLIDCININNFALKAPSSRNHDLARSIAYICYGSGVMNTLYKVKTIWGSSAVNNIILHALNFLKNWEPNEECDYWLSKHSDDYKHNYPTFNDFMDESVSVVIAEKKTSR